MKKNASGVWLKTDNYTSNVRPPSSEVYRTPIVDEEARCSAVREKYFSNLLKTYKKAQTAARKLLTAEEKYYENYEKQAVGRGKEFSLTIEQFYEIKQRACTYCGDKNRDLNGIDRIDNLSGYYYENCQPCCHQCNTMKFKYSEIAFLEQIRKIYKYMNL